MAIPESKEDLDFYCNLHLLSMYFSGIRRTVGDRRGKSMLGENRCGRMNGGWVEMFRGFNKTNRVRYECT